MDVIFSCGFADVGWFAPGGVSDFISCHVSSSNSLFDDPQPVKSVEKAVKKNKVRNFFVTVLHYLITFLCPQ